MNSFQTPPTGQHRKQLVSSDDPSVDTKMPAFEGSPDRSLVLLEKKIEKTKIMMDEAEKNEKKGRDSKLWNRLSMKLQQYKQEVANAIERHSDPTTPIGARPNFAESSPSPFPASPTSPHDSAQTLQKKIKKVDKLMMDMIEQYGEEKAPHRKLYQKYRQKKDSYEQSLLGFEARVRDETKKQLSANAFPEVEESTQASPVKSRKAPNSTSRSHNQKESTKKMLGKDGKKKHKKGPKKKSARVAARRIVELEKEFQPQMHPKSKEIEDILRQEIKRNFIFSKLRDIDRLLGAFEITRDYQRDELVVEQHEVSHPVFFYIIISGQVEYEVDNIVVGNASIGNSFGEQGLLYSCPRKATVRATATTKLCRLDQITFRYIMQSQSKFQEVWKQATRKVMAMNRLLGAVATMKMMEDDVCEQEPSSNYKEDLSEEAPTLSELKIDEGFNSEYCVGFMDEMSSRRLSTRKCLTESCASFESYSRESLLGEGQFGEVWKVRPKMQELKDKEFALKIQAKDNVFRESTPGMIGTVSEAIERECEILSRLCHPFICEFVHNFEEEENIYLVMGLIRGEELWSIVHREMDDGEWESGIQELSAIFYGALIADALAYMHHLKICFRDLVSVAYSPSNSASM